MSTQAEAVSSFLSELSLHFGKRFETEDAEDQWLDSMERNLKGYTPSVLKRACQKIIDTRKDRYFPLPAECRKACEEVIKIDRAEATPSFIPGSVDPKNLQSKYDQAYAHADWLIMQGPMGKQAANEGWILTLHDFIRENGHLPKDYEITKCKATAKGFDEDYAKCLRGEAGYLSKSLAGLAETMLKRRYKLTDMVLHGVVK
jgi:hypothetical protein